MYKYIKSQKVKIVIPCTIEPKAFITSQHTKYNFSVFELSLC